MNYLMGKSSFSAKILLFGEYTLLVGSKALAMPLPIFRGNFCQGLSPATKIETDSNKELLKFAEYLNSNERFSFIQSAAFLNDCKKGISFQSNIPQGYGVGSSGAVVAAIYQKYRIGLNNDLTLQKQELSLMESFFHGESSGIDPLVIYQNKSLIINTLSNISILDKEINFERHGIKPFLIDTKTTSPTAPLVQHFKQTIKNQEFKTILTEQINPLVNSIIEQLVSHKKTSNILNKIKRLSELQLKYFIRQIPPHIIPIWEEGLKTDAFYLKLCGSGGGGYLLGFKRDEKDIPKAIKKKDFPKATI